MLDWQLHQKRIKPLKKTIKYENAHFQQYSVSINYDFYPIKLHYLREYCIAGYLSSIEKRLQILISFSEQIYFFQSNSEKHLRYDNGLFYFRGEYSRWDVSDNVKLDSKLKKSSAYLVLEELINNTIDFENDIVDEGARGKLESLLSKSNASTYDEQALTVRDRYQGLDDVKKELFLTGEELRKIFSILTQSFLRSMIASKRMMPLNNRQPIYISDYLIGLKMHDIIYNCWLDVYEKKIDSYTEKINKYNDSSNHNTFSFLKKSEPSRPSWLDDRQKFLKTYVLERHKMYSMYLTLTAEIDDIIDCNSRSNNTSAIDIFLEEVLKNDRNLFEQMKLSLDTGCQGKYNHFMLENDP